MPLRQLSLNQFRNLSSTTLEFDSHLNIFEGKNASGKTSLLEAIHIVCEGQSFRTHHLKQCIRHYQDDFLLFGKFSDHQVGISKTQEQRIIKINGQITARRSELVLFSPVRMINTDSLDIVMGKPSMKREFIDWCLFHVEPSYPDLWKQHGHALKQKNALLKTKTDDHQIDYWNEYLLDYNLRISRYRKDFLSRLKNILFSELSNLMDYERITFTYEPGWDINKSLSDIYRIQRQREIKYGYSLYGIHRDNIHISQDGIPVQHCLSRGQLKKLSVALLIAQVILVNRETGKPVIILVDDLSSELDSVSVSKILEVLRILNAQIFLTFIKYSDHPVKGDQEVKWFHVEHGIIKPVKNV